jgi:hypothetical protein
MYDFILLAPHGSGSNSITRYINQHPEMTVAPYQVIQRSLDDVSAYERLFRPWMKSVGIATKDYATRTTVEGVLAASQRNTLIQMVRDPIEMVVSLYRTAQMVTALSQGLGNPMPLITLDEHIDTALTWYITPAAAAAAYQAHTFASHTVIDTSELRGPGSEAVTKSIWRRFAGTDTVPNAVYKPLGSNPYHMTREFLNHVFFVEKLKINLAIRFEGDVDWSVKLRESTYYGPEARLHSFPDARTVMPNCGISDALHIWAPGIRWVSLHPSLRIPVAKKHLPDVLMKIGIFNDAYGKAAKQITFSANDFSPTQRETLKRGIGNDVATFLKQHPSLTEKWKTTVAFLGG